MKILYSIGLIHLMQPTTAQTQNLCATMGNVPPPPQSSSCWTWWTPPKDGIVTSDMPEPQKGCDDAACEKAVCDCDSYCCDVAWDESCRGYQQEVNGPDNNYFVSGCSARILCCEPDVPPVPAPVAQAVLPILSEIKDVICENIKTPPPPITSTCWEWWTPPANGIVTSDMPEPQKGCDHKPCQDAVCQCVVVINKNQILFLKIITL